MCEFVILATYGAYYMILTDKGRLRRTEEAVQSFKTVGFALDQHRSVSDVSDGRRVGLLHCVSCVSTRDALFTSIRPHYLDHWSGQPG